MLADIGVKQHSSIDINNVQYLCLGNMYSINNIWTFGFWHGGWWTGEPLIPVFSVRVCARGEEMTTEMPTVSGGAREVGRSAAGWAEQPRWELEARLHKSVNPHYKCTRLRPCLPLRGCSERSKE